LSGVVRLAVALVLALPVLTTGWSLLISASFLAEFLSDGAWHPLSAITHVPSIEPLPASVGSRPVSVDLYEETGASRPSPGLVLVHGLSPRGKDDPRLQHAASLLARAGWAVAVPTVDGLTVLRLRPDDALAVAATVQALEQAGHRPVAILGVSLGAGPALLAAADPRVSSCVSAVLTLGGYASAVELLRYTLTGAYRFDHVSGHRPVNESAIAQFARANAELVDAAGRRLVDNRDPRAVNGLIGELPAGTRQLLAALSPERVIARLRAPLFLIHGRDDPAVPFTESLRLARAARAAGQQPIVVIVGSLGHVEPEQRASPLDPMRLEMAFYAFRAASMHGCCRACV
jgi:pimeloyl-ACP methyl ester carboxylesterase